MAERDEHELQEREDGDSQVTQQPGDLFEAEPGVLLHSVNCQGSWGSGIALALKKRFPSAFEEYRDECKDKDASELLGTTFICEAEEGYRIACLFTSAKYGRAKDSPDSILQNTKRAVENLIHQIKERPDLQDKNLAAVKLNAGAFAVPWDQTKAILEELFSKSDLQLTIYDK